MPTTGKPERTDAFRLIVAVAVVAIFSITTATFAAQAFHSGESGHDCAICHLGYMPLLNPGTGIELFAPADVVVPVAIEAPMHEPYFFVASQPARAPPA